MKRILLIARREYGAYARTVGFWLSLLAFPMFAVLGGGIPLLIKSSEPVNEVVLIEEGPGATGLAAARPRPRRRNRRPRPWFRAAPRPGPRAGRC